MHESNDKKNFCKHVEGLVVSLAYDIILPVNFWSNCTVPVCTVISYSAKALYLEADFG